MIIPATKRTKRKFGLAWLFSLDEEDLKAEAADIEERIRGTWLTLEAEAEETERRVEATTRLFSRWQSGSWPGNCTILPRKLEHAEPDDASNHIHAKESVPITTDTKEVNEE